MSEVITNPHPLVPAIRDASRQLVRELGFMKLKIAGTDLTPSAIHAIFEIGGNQVITTSTLRTRLNADESGVSLTLRDLVQAGEITEEQTEFGSREARLSLTPAGWKTLAKINAFAQEQVTQALNQLSPASAESILNGLRQYASALQTQRLGKPTQNASNVVVKSGYRPGVLARVMEMQMQYYGSNWGFGSTFESELSVDVGKLLLRLDKPQNEVWAAMDGNRIVGAVFIDGENLGPDKAHLRAFIVDDGIRGGGVGRRLIQEAVVFSDRLGYPETHLWTFKGLSAARRLYLSCGFVQESEMETIKWGKELTVQHLVRKITP